MNSNDYQYNFENSTQGMIYNIDALGLFSTKLINNNR